MVELVGLKGFENHYPWELSGGMQQRANLCRALVHEPQDLLLVQPLGHPAQRANAQFRGDLRK